MKRWKSLNRFCVSASMVITSSVGFTDTSLASGSEPAYAILISPYAFNEEGKASLVQISVCSIKDEKPLDCRPVGGEGAVLAVEDLETRAGEITNRGYYKLAGITAVVLLSTAALTYSSYAVVSAGGTGAPAWMKTLAYPSLIAIEGMNRLGIHGFGVLFVGGVGGPLTLSSLVASGVVALWDAANPWKDWDKAESIEEVVTAADQIKQGEPREISLKTDDDLRWLDKEIEDLIVEVIRLEPAPLIGVNP